jgi:hypothetical protein
MVHAGFILEKADANMLDSNKSVTPAEATVLPPAAAR